MLEDTAAHCGALTPSLGGGLRFKPVPAID